MGGVHHPRACTSNTLYQPVLFQLTFEREFHGLLVKQSVQLAVWVTRRILFLTYVYVFYLFHPKTNAWILISVEKSPHFHETSVKKIILLWQWSNNCQISITELHGRKFSSKLIIIFLRKITGVHYWSLGHFCIIYYFISNSDTF